MIKDMKLAAVVLAMLFTLSACMSPNAQAERSLQKIKITAIQFEKKENRYPQNLKELISFASSNEIQLDLSPFESIDLDNTLGNVSISYMIKKTGGGGHFTITGFETTCGPSE